MENETDWSKQWYVEQSKEAQVCKCINPPSLCMVHMEIQYIYNVNVMLTCYIAEVSIITNVQLYAWHDVSSSSEEFYTKFRMVTNDMAQNDQNTLASSGEESFDFSNSFNKS